MWDGFHDHKGGMRFIPDTYFLQSLSMFLLANSPYGATQSAWYQGPFS